MKTGIGFKFADFIYMLTRAFICVTLALINGWKFSIMFLLISPFLMIFATIMTVMIKKFTELELKSYREANNIAQESLSSLRTILSFGLQKKVVNSYNDNLKIMF